MFTDKKYTRIANMTDTKPFINITNDLILTQWIIKISKKNGTIKSIELNLTNYYQSLNPEIKSYSLLLTYSNFGQIEEIANPIS